MTTSLGTRAVLIAAAALALGCSPGSSGSSSTGTAAAGRAGAATSAPGRARGFDESALLELGKLAVPGFELVAPAKETVMGTVTAVYRSVSENAEGVRAGATVVVGDCLPGACRKMDKAAWRNARSELYEQLTMPRIHADNPNVEWDFDETIVEGKKAVVVYVLSLVKTPRERDDALRASTASMHSLSVSYNDGQRQLRVGVYGQGGKSAASVEELRQLFPRQEMLGAARVLAAAFLKRF
ncbi:MAG: hypothetical protein IT373_19615 [Polyangiaceae bacterium]|nr:hypothetical protein [Polyangiaceae bacterium]